MEQSQLLELIQTLNPPEKDQLLFFATNPFFNQGRFKHQIISLLEICIKYRLNSSSENLKKLDVFAKIFPNQPFVEGKLEKVMVETHKILRIFLLTQEYFKESNEFQQVYDFAEIVRKRGLDTRYLKLLSNLQKIQSESRWKNATHYYHQFLLEDAIHGEEGIKNQIKGDLNIPNVLEALGLHYHLHLISRLNYFLLQQKVAKLDVPESIMFFLEHSHVPEKYREKSPVLKVHYEIFILLKKEVLIPSDIQFLFDLLLLHEKDIDPATLREFYTYLRNLCVLISYHFFDNEEIRVTLFNLYQDNLIRGYLHFEGKIHPTTYMAVTIAAIRVNQTSWALDFIRKYKDDIIGENETQDIYRFNMALYLFGVGRFSECLDNIPPTSPFLQYQIQGKRLELKALYELNSDLLPYKLDAFKMFLSRTSQKLLSEVQRLMDVDFANFLMQLINTTPGNQIRADRLVKRIEAKKQVHEWLWLLEKAKQLAKK